jgi:hypothetical protein
MNILAVDGVPVKPEAGKADTSRKLRLLREAGEDFEFYPTTPEIMAAMGADLFDYLRGHKGDYSAVRHGREQVKINREYNEETETLGIETFLDIGAGDGRVLDYFSARKKYGIEIARAQADDLIRRGIFIIGRDYWDCSLVGNKYGLVFSNPPYSCFERWVAKLLEECDFEILYLVMPVRWKNIGEITRRLERYEAAVVGEFDFSQADRAARGRVNLVRVNAPWTGHIDTDGHAYKTQKTLEDAFSRWVREYIADFEEKPRLDWEKERERELALKQTPIDLLVGSYECEKEALGEAFRAIGKLDAAIIKLMGQDRDSMLEIIRKSIEGLRLKYWRAAFNKIDAVRERMTKRTRERIFNSIEEFNGLDFNAGNIYSVIIWTIHNTNIGILDQIGEVFDALTDKEYIEEYKSNRHWVKGDWKHTSDRYSERHYESLPDRWKIGLDYRIVIRTWGGSDEVVNDFIVVCGNLGFPIRGDCKPDFKLHSEIQKFYTADGVLAFTMRYYTGNKNAHLKIDKKLLMKFNIEVAKIRKWLSVPEEAVEEFDLTEAEAAELWNGGLSLLGKPDMKALGFE